MSRFRRIFILLWSLAYAGLAYGTDCDAMVDVRPDRELIGISNMFYGINVHPGTIDEEIKYPRLFDRLGADTARVMVMRRVNWSGGRKEYPLSIGPNEVDWTLLDDLIYGLKRSVKGLHVVLGYGPPDWIRRREGGRELSPPQDKYFMVYRDLLIGVASRYATKAQGEGSIYFSVENEPENVGYTLGQYLELFNEVRAGSKFFPDSVKVGGPAIGYAYWKQSGSISYSFSHSVDALSKSGFSPDFFDWHVYSTSPDVISKTVDVVREKFVTQPLIVSEFNRNWRYSAGDGYARAVEDNTGWSSVSWFLEVVDRLQLKGVDRAIYFTWRDDSLGLIDKRSRYIRPVYFPFQVLARDLARRRVECSSSSGALGCIATESEGRRAIVLYNKSDNDVSVDLRAGEWSIREFFRYDQDWYESNKAISGEDAGAVRYLKLGPDSLAGNCWMVSKGGMLSLLFY